MKKVTPTPNRFTTCTPSWWAKGFIVFSSLFFFGSCLDEAALIGLKKDAARFEVQFMEFSIPVTTVQADSVGSENNGVPTQTTSVYDRMLCGSVIDPKFGEINASFFAQYLPSPSKINQTGKTDFFLQKVTVKFALDYYIYGDTIDGPSQFSLHEITDENFKLSNNYYTSSDEVQYNLTPLATGTYDFLKTRFRRDSITEYRKRNADTNKSNDVYDTLFFELPIESPFDLGRVLYDTAKKKGIYTKVKITGTEKDTLVFDDFRTDSAFLTRFKGFAVKPISGGRVLGFTSLFSNTIGSSLVTVYYGYKEGSVQKNGRVYYSFQGQSSYTKIQPTNRNGTYLDGMVTKYENYNAADDYCYLQGGTGVYAKLDFTEVNDFLGQIENLAVNGAELIIPVDAPTVRSHLSVPSGLLLRTVQNNNRFFVPPQIQLNGSDGKPAFDSQGNPIMGPDPQYGFRYYSATNDTYLDALGDDAKILNLQYVKSRSNEYFFRGYLTQFIEYHNRLPESFSRIDYLGLVPSNFQFGKTLDGVSFKKDQVKLRVYYTEIQ